MAYIYHYKHGTLEVKQTDSNPRWDVWTPVNGTPILEHCLVRWGGDTSPRVTSDRQSPYYRQYNPECSCCWLGISHSIDKHDSSVEGF